MADLLLAERDASLVGINWTSNSWSSIATFDLLINTFYSVLLIKFDQLASHAAQLSSQVLPKNLLGSYLLSNIFPSFFPIQNITTSSAMFPSKHRPTWSRVKSSRLKPNRLGCRDSRLPPRDYAQSGSTSANYMQISLRWETTKDLIPIAYLRVCFHKWNTTGFPQLLNKTFEDVIQVTGFWRSTL